MFATENIDLQQNYSMSSPLVYFDNPIRIVKLTKYGFTN